jgi:flagellar motor switch protein FliG
MAASPESRPGAERAAILLMALGEQDAAEVLKHLSAKEVQRVGSAMAQMANIPREEVAVVLEQFSSHIEQQSSVGIDSDEYVRKVLKEALGSDKANSIIDRILRSRSGRGLESLKWMEPRAIAEMLRVEHPQITSIVLSYLDSDQSAEVLSALPENMRSDIITRIALLDGVHPSALNELDEVLEKQFAGNNGSKSSGFGGPKVAAEILNLVGTNLESKIIGEKLQDLMFVFADLVSVDDRGMQELLREVPGEKLLIALKAAEEQMKDKIFKNMSERAAQMMKDDLEAKGPVKLSEVEAAQKEIVLTARRLADEGRLQLGGKGGEEYV